jgi:hypothetical protein
LHDFDIRLNSRTIADAFSVFFIYYNRLSIITRFHNELEVEKFGYKHAWQRWYRCVRTTIAENMLPALLLMYEQRQPEWDRTLGDFDRDMLDERVDIAGSYVRFYQEAIDEFKRRLKEDDIDLPVEVLADVLFQLKKMKVVASLKSLFSIEQLDEFYSELNLKGDENFLPSVWEIERNRRKIRKEPKSSWRLQIERLVHVNIANLDPGESSMICMLAVHFSYHFFVYFLPLFFRHSS